MKSPADALNPGHAPPKETEMSETMTENTTTTETKTKKGKAPKKPAKAKAAAPKTKTPKAAKPDKPKRERKPKEENLMTFAFRMPKAESEALHKAAGPANASRTMRALADAFVREDRAVFESIVMEARKLRA
jgi:hypothetical protein